MLFLSLLQLHSADWLWVQTNVVFTCWFIWKARCDFVFNQVRINPTKVVLTISNGVGSFLAAIRNNEDIGVRKSVGQASSLVPRRIPPPSPFTKINVDASWFKLSMSGFVGIVMRDADK